jgi:uncharacterized protein (UPF0332 family)
VENATTKHWRLEKAKRFMNAAERSLERSDYETAVSRAYYACYLSIVRLMESRAGIRRPRWDHVQLQTEFRRSFASKSYLFSVRQARDLEELQASRLVADYENRQATTRQVEGLMTKARGLLSAVLEEV